MDGSHEKPVSLSPHFSKPGIKQQNISTILDLPYELRQLIFTFALVSPAPRWERLHDIHCKWKPRKTGECERPLFTFHNDNGKMICPCKCGKRTAAFGLLGANRAVRTEAAPIFWSQNEFSFGDAESFVLDFAGPSNDDTVPPRFRLPDPKRKLGRGHGPFLYASELIQRLVMFNNVDNERREAYSGYWLSDFWKALPRLRALRTLELPPAWLDSSSECLAALRDGLPHLRSVSMCEFVGFYPCQAPSQRDGYLRSDDNQIWAKVCREVDLRVIDRMDGLTGEVLAFEVDLIEDVEGAIERGGRQAPEESDSGDGHQTELVEYVKADPFFPCHLSELTACNGVGTVQLEDDSILRLPLFGLPLNAEEVTANEGRRRDEEVARWDFAAVLQELYNGATDYLDCPPWVRLKTQCKDPSKCPEGNGSRSPRPSERVMLGVRVGLDVLEQLHLS